jgi:hypothetical protein
MRVPSAQLAATTHLPVAPDAVGGSSLGPPVVVRAAGLRRSQCDIALVIPRRKLSRVVGEQWAQRTTSSFVLDRRREAQLLNCFVFT